MLTSDQIGLLLAALNLAFFLGGRRWLGSEAERLKEENARALLMRWEQHDKEFETYKNGVARDALECQRREVDLRHEMVERFNKVLSRLQLELDDCIKDCRKFDVRITKLEP